MRNNLFNLPDNWQWVKSESVIDVRDGTHDTPEYHSDGVPFITSKNLVNGSVDFNGAAFISLKDHNKFSQRSKVDNGDILLAMIGTIGNPVLVETDREFSIKNVALFKFTGSDVNNRYFRHLLDSKIIKRQMALASRGGTQKFVSLKVLRNLNIPLPPLAEQKRIAAILDKADMLRTKRRAALAKLDSLVQSVFLEMFGDPVTNPMGWEERKLDETVNFTTGKLDSNAGVPGAQYPFFTCAREVYQIDKYAFDCEALLLAGNNASADYWVKHYSGRFNAYQRTYVITLKHEQDSFRYNYMKYALESKLLLMKRLSKGSNTRYLTLSILKPIKIQVPDVETMTKFGLITNEIGNHFASNQTALTQLDNLFQALQQRAFRGEL